MVSSFITRITSSTLAAPLISFLVASTSRGTPARCGLSIKACSSSVATFHADGLCVLWPAAVAGVVALVSSVLGVAAVVEAGAGAGAGAEVVLVGAAVVVDVAPDSALELGSGTDESTTNTMAETPRQ